MQFRETIKDMYSLPVSLTAGIQHTYRSKVLFTVHFLISVFSTLPETHHWLQKSDGMLPDKSDPPGDRQAERRSATCGQPVPVSAGRLHKRRDEEGGG